MVNCHTEHTGARALVLEELVLRGVVLEERVLEVLVLVLEELVLREVVLEELVLEVLVLVMNLKKSSSEGGASPENAVWTPWPVPKSAVQT